MTTIEFSIIPDTDADYQTFVRLMSEFKAETGVEVNLKRMSWDTAWQQLISIATQGHDTDISHVGSTWVSSLIAMNAVRPIPTSLIAKIGGEQAFVHSTWASVTSEEDRNVYGIPLSAYVYIIAYRKDLLAKAGLNGGNAFATPQSVEESVQKLEALNAVENTWLMPYMPHPFIGLMHPVASWVWSSGGHFLDNRGKQVLFNSPAALSGLKACLRLMRRMPNAKYFNADDCMNALLTGHAAAVVSDTRALNTAIRDQSPNIENIGAASLMSIPWSGGSSVVVWRHTHGYPDRLAASYKLAEFLVRKQTMLDRAKSSFTLPSRTDALDELFTSNHPLRPVMLQLISTGRSYRPITLWHRIEYQFGLELGLMAKELMENPNADLDATVTRVIDSLAERLNLTLG